MGPSGFCGSVDGEKDSRSYYFNDSHKSKIQIFKIRVAIWEQISSFGIFQIFHFTRMFIICRLGNDGTR